MNPRDMYSPSIRVIYILLSLIVFPVSACNPLEDPVFEEIIYINQDQEVQTGNQHDDEPNVQAQIIVKTHQIMTLQDNTNPHSQGGDCWGDYFFQFSKNNAVIRIYNLKDKELIQKFIHKNNGGGFVSNCHCNSVCFGSEYYEEGDEFPLLYVSTGYGNNGYTGALVYRITKEKGLFSFSLVQTLRFPVLKSSWTEFIPAGNVCYVCYTSDYIVYKMPMPSVHDGDVIIDGSKGALEVFQFPPQPQIMKNSRNQGRLYYKGKIVLTSGVPGSREASVLVVLDLETRTYEHIFDFFDMGLNTESESIFFWRDRLCVAFDDQIVSFEFDPDILAQ